jgi:putative FmdB family regulatory protein
MPIYDYHCDVCDNTFTDYFKFGRVDPIPEVQECPECKQLTAKRQFPCPHAQLDFHKPIELFSLAPVKKEEVDNFRQQNPDIQCEGDPASDMYGVPVVHNEQERSRVLKHFHYAVKEKKR